MIIMMSLVSDQMIAEHIDKIFMFLIRVGSLVLPFLIIDKN